MPESAAARANASFSDRNPELGWIACAPVRCAIARITSARRYDSRAGAGPSRQASSQAATWRALASASEYTATVRMPSRRAVAATRHAISPRLAIRSLLNIGCLRVGVASGLRGHPGRAALVEERGDALLALVGRPRRGDARGRVADQRVVDRTADHVADQALALAQRDRAALHQVAEQRVDRAVELLRHADVVDQPDPVSLGRLEDLGGEEVAARLRFADRADHVGADHRRDQPELDLGQAELRVGAGDRDVAGGDQAHAPGERGTVHARDGRLRVLVDRA